MSQLRTVTKTRPARGFGTPDETYEQLQVKHEFRILAGESDWHVEKIRKPKWEDVPHVAVNGLDR